MIKKLLISALIFAGNFANSSDVFLVESSKASATAFTVVTETNNTYVITNNHVCNKEPFLIMRINTTVHVLPVLRISSTSDLCVLRTNLNTGFKLAKDYDTKEYVRVEGFPELKHAVFEGELTAENYIPAFKNFFLSLNVPCKSGSSGSPVLNKNNEVIGVVSLVSTNPKYNWTGAVPLEYLKEVLSGL